jgi:hypothetical protein
MPLPLCANCQRPATLVRPTASGDVPTCDRCIPGDWSPDDGVRRIEAPTPTDPTRAALLTRADAAAYLGGMSEDHFDRHVRPHVPVRMVGKTPMFRPADLDAYAASGSVDL